MWFCNTILHLGFLRLKTLYWERKLKQRFTIGTSVPSWLVILMVNWSSVKVLACKDIYDCIYFGRHDVWHQRGPTQVIVSHPGIVYDYVPRD